jgi:predicted ATPase/class 3 adenylate cyclase
VNCPQCGRAIADHDRFCGGCGASLADACRGCGQPLAAGVAFCTSCGAPRTEATQAGVATEDRRRVSVLFIDLVGFTPYAERADPEVVRRLQHSFYAIARRVVAQHGGVVEKYIGDAIMALFGAPVATETDALRCVRAGLELQRGLAAEGQIAQGDLRFRVGVATGEALVDVAAARDGGQAIVAGDVVNVAARIESVAPAGGVLVCGRTHALTASAIRYAPQAPTTLRGRTRPTEVWLALAPAPRQQADATVDSTPLVEREHELGLLTGALHRVVRDRTPRLVTIFGQAGIGKSRLVRELHQRADELAGAPVVWRTGHCPPFGENVTYAGLADILKAETGILDTDPAETVRQRLDQAVRPVVAGAEADRLTDALQPLVGLPAAHQPGGAEEAESAWRRFLVALARRGPTVLVFEDLHWADEAMRRFIELLAATARDVPLLVLGTARPELIDQDASWAGTITGSLTITLSPLRSTGMTTLCSHLLGQAAFTADALRPLVELANGNPLYAQEYVRMLVERGVVAQATKGWHTGTENAPPMPDSVHAVIANRVDLLEPVDRAVLQAAAVVGMQFWPGAVAASLGRPASSVDPPLRRLEQRDFITEQHESSMAGQSEFRFGHILVRDVCYQRLPRTERVARHERTADWLEGLSRQRGTDLAEVVAHHRWAACEIGRTVGMPAGRLAPAARRALYLAARRAYALHALDAAANHTARALTLLPAAVPDRDRDPDREVGAGSGLAEHALRPEGTGRESAARALEQERLRLELLATEIAFYQDHTGFLAGGGADQLRALAQRLTVPSAPMPSGAGNTAEGAASGELTRDAARAWTLLGQAAWVRADREGALRHLDQAVALFAPLPDSPEMVDAYAELGRLHMLNYECEPAIAAAGTAAAIAQRLGLAEAQANARITIATARYESRDPSGLDELHAVTEHCRANRLMALRRAARNLAHVVREEGDWQRSEVLLAEGNQLNEPGSHNVVTDPVDEAMRALFTGDLAALAAVADAADAAASGWREMRNLRAFVRVLREEPPADYDEAGEALAAAREAGFHRQLWVELADTALCRALQQRRAEAAELLTELAARWRKVPVIASGAWVTKAAFAAALTGPGPAEALRVPLAELPRHTDWSEAALQTVTGAVARASGEDARAGEHHLVAAGIYARISTVTDRMLALALAAAAFTRAGETARAEPALAEVRAFAERNAAPGMLRLCDPAPPVTEGST